VVTTPLVGVAADRVDVATREQATAAADAAAPAMGEG